MDPPIDPADHTVQELEAAVDEIDDPQALDSLLEAEREGENRTTAIEAIETRLEELETAIAEDRSAIQPIEEGEDVLTLAGPDEDRELSERLLHNLSGIRHSLEDARQAGGQFEARLRRLENEVGDLTAYTDALEAFLDEDGTAQQVLESVQSELAALEEGMDDVKPVVRSHAKSLRDHRLALEDLEEALDDHATSLDAVADDVESLEARFEHFSDEASAAHEAHADRLEAVEGRLADQSGRIDEVVEGLDAVGDATDELEAAVDDRFASAAEERTEIADRVGGNDATIDDHAGRLETLGDDVDGLESRLGETDRVDERFEQLEADVREIQSWREQLGSVLGGGMGPTEDADD